MAQGYADQMTHSAVDIEQADAGIRRINWADQQMPLLKTAVLSLASDEKLEGLHIGVCLPLDANNACFVLKLAEAGAKVSYCSTVPATDHEITNALKRRGVPLYVESMDGKHVLLTDSPDILIEDGMQMLQLALREHSDFSSLKAAVINVQSGVAEQLVASEQTKIPVLNLGSTQLVKAVNNTHGWGQATVMAMLDITNLQIAGRNVLVIGYGSAGRGIALHAAALGARVTVAEIDPLKAMQAQYDGHVAKSIAESAAVTEVVFTATGCSASLSSEHIEAMPNGVIVCAAGGGSLELPMQYLADARSRESVRANVTDYGLSNGKHVLLLAGGDCIASVAGEGLPVEIADKGLALKVHALRYLLKQKKSVAAGLQSLPEIYEEQMAHAYLAATGATLEPVR